MSKKFLLKDKKTISPWILQLHSALFQNFHISWRLWKPELNRNLRNSICSRNTLWIPKSWVYIRKTPLFWSTFAVPQNLHTSLHLNWCFYSRFTSDLHTNMCKLKDKYSRAILGPWSCFTGPSDGLKDYDNAGSFRESTVWCSIPRLS